MQLLIQSWSLSLGQAYMAYLIQFRYAYYYAGRDHQSEIKFLISNVPTILLMLLI